MYWLRNKWTLRALGIVSALLIWEALGRTVGEALLAGPLLVIPELVELVADGEMPRELAGSLRQMLLGYALACCVGMPLGVAMGRSRIFDAIMRPWVNMLVVTSVASLVPLLIVMVGTGFGFRVLVVFIASVFYIVLTAYQGTRGIDPRWVDVGRSFNASRLRTFWRILLPASYPFLITGARIGLVQAIRGMVVAELFVIVGIGGLVHNGGLYISTANLLALMVTLMAVGVTANEALRYVGRRLAPWYEERYASGA